MYRYFNNNPAGRSVGDCAVRAVSKALGISWEDAYAQMATNGYKMADKGLIYTGFSGKL